METAPPDPADVVARLEQAASRIRAAAVAPLGPEGSPSQGHPELPGAPEGSAGALPASDPLAQVRAELAEVRAQLVAAAAQLDALA